MEIDYTRRDESNNFESLKSEQMIEALKLARKGWPIVPLHYPTPFGCSCSSLNCKSAGKHPMNEHGCSEPLRNEESVFNWWNHNACANVGILTGKETGLVVLDIDPRHEGDISLAQLEKEFGKLPETLKVRTWWSWCFPVC